MLSPKQREAIRRHTSTELLWLLVPGPGWRSRILPADQPELGSLRPRALLLVLVGTALGIGIFWSIDPPGPLADPDPPDRPTARRPAAPAEPGVSLPAPSQPEARDSGGAPIPSAVPEPSLAEKRTQPALFGDAKVTAVYEGHDVRGVRVQNVGPGSFWDLVGVRSGDVVIAHNGALVDTPTAMVALLNSLERDLVIRLRVRGLDDEERTLYYSAPR